MGKPVSTAQSHAVMQALACNVSWSKLDGDRMQAEVIKNSQLAGAQLTAFLEASPERRAMFVEGYELKRPGTISIDRSTPLNPAFLLFAQGEGWDIGKEDKASLAIHELDLSKVRLVKLGAGSGRRKRLKKPGRILLDGNICEAIWLDKLRIPEQWKKDEKGQNAVIFFDGTEILDGHGRLYFLCLSWDGSEWEIDHWLEEAREEHHLSAVIDGPKPVKEKAEPFRVLSAEINLDARPAFPFNNGAIEEHKGGGRVTIQRQSDGLYVDGHKVVFHRSESQLNGKEIQGHKLRDELKGKSTLNACVLDFLVDNPSFVPDEMKEDENGNTVYTFFWGTIYRLDTLWVRYCYWSGDRLRWRCNMVGYEYGLDDLAACLTM